MIDSGRKIVGRAALARIARRMEDRGKRLVFTNGCFDLLHAGHVRLLKRARRLGDALAVAVNSDASVRRLKGRGRPVTPQRERLEILASLESVDYVVVFTDPTPGALIRAVRPHVLVKGGDWRRSRIVGRGTVEAAGGRVRVIPLEKSVSTTRIIRRILARFGR
ncbi:MAG TPA: D-glycero-beta-D-manno-heptose 1-phosphate adenylyltransferase [Candidatus Polarisedimenticolia bacterium]|nr:D-glycero-beta-D-manno-heptose 1-phosphate adenylyltransferase [Candidatus Polarisedimenticolia bacterium]